MPKASWNGVTIAEAPADRCEHVEGNCYFPADGIKNEHFRPSGTRSTCAWKGEASYYDVVVGDSVNKDAAWYYPVPKEAAAQIKNRVAFWKGVKVEE